MGDAPGDDAAEASGAAAGGPVESDGKAAFDATAGLRALLEEHLQVDPGTYLRELAARGLDGDEMLRELRERIPRSVGIGGVRLGQLLVAEAWANGEIKTPRKMARDAVVAAERKALAEGAPSPGQAAASRTAAVRADAAALIGQGQYKKRLAEFVARARRPVDIIKWLREASGGRIQIDEQCAADLMVVAVWESAARAGLVDAPPAVKRPQADSRSRQGQGESLNRRGRPAQRSELSATPRSGTEEARSPRLDGTTGRTRSSEPRSLRPSPRRRAEAVEQQLNAMLPSPAGDYIVKQLKLAKAGGMNDAQAFEHVTRRHIARFAAFEATTEDVMAIARMNGWRTNEDRRDEAARRRALKDQRRRHAEERRQRAASEKTPAKKKSSADKKRKAGIKKGSRPRAGSSSGGSVWTRLANSRSVRFVSGGLPGLGRRR